MINCLEAALAGDVEAASHLIAAADNDKRGILAVAFWRAEVPRPAYQELLESAWNHDHPEVIAATGNRRTLQAMFRYA